MSFACKHARKDQPSASPDLPPLALPRLSRPVSTPALRAVTSDPPSAPPSWITLRFGFLNGWFGRGMFYLFVGTTVMGKGKDGFWKSFSYVVGAICLFIGAVELLFGFKCAESDLQQADEEAQRQRNAPPPAPVPAAQEPAKKSWFGGGKSRAPTEPTLTVTPGQVAGAASWAAANPNTVATVANAAAPVAGAAASGGAASGSNPFFGNNHLNNQR